MNYKYLFTILFLLFIPTCFSFAQEKEDKYIEVTGTSEIEIVPDEIHYIIEIKEYWEEEFYPNSEPKDYRTKVPLSRIEQKLRKALYKTGLTEKDIRMQEAGDYWREQGRDFLVAKQFDITLRDFNQIDKILKTVDTKGIHSMRIGELKNKDIHSYRQQGKIEALKAARNKAAYLVEAMGKQLGDVLRIVEPADNPNYPGFRAAQSNVSTYQAGSFDAFRTLKLNYAMSVRFEIK